MKNRSEKDKYKKVSSLGFPYYYPSLSKQPGAKKYVKNLSGYSMQTSRGSVWEPFWTDNIDRLENLYNKLILRSRAALLKALNTFATTEKFYVKNDDNKMNFYYPVDKHHVSIVEMKVNQTKWSSSSYSDNVVKKNQLFQKYLYIEEWPHQNPKLFKVWKQYKKEIRYFYSVQNRINKVKEVLKRCLTSLLNKKYEKSKLDNIIIHLNINERKYHIEYDAPIRNEYYRVGTIKSFINLENHIPLKVDELYV